MGPEVAISIVAPLARCCEHISVSSHQERGSLKLTAILTPLENPISEILMNSSIGTPPLHVVKTSATSSSDSPPPPEIGNQRTSILKSKQRAHLNAPQHQLSSLLPSSSKTHLGPLARITMTREPFHNLADSPALQSLCARSVRDAQGDQRELTNRRQFR